MKSLLTLIAIFTGIAMNAQENAQIIPDYAPAYDHQVSLFGGQSMGKPMTDNHGNSHPVVGINYRYNLGECSSKCASQCCLTKLISTHVRLNAQYLPEVRTASEFMPEVAGVYESAEGYRIDANIGISLKNPAKEWMRNIAFEWGITFQSITKSFPVQYFAPNPDGPMHTSRTTYFGPSMALYFPIFHSKMIGIDIAGHAHGLKDGSDIMVPVTLGINAGIKF